jgi:hypothetical protein
MPGPCSTPDGDKRRHEELNEIVCNIHFTCDMDERKAHEYITLRQWLCQRNKLRTGKTL